MQVSHRTVGNNYSASSHLLSQSDGNTGWKGHLEVFSLTCLKWDCLQHVIASAMALSGQVLKMTRNGAVYHAGSAFVCFCLRVVPSEPPHSVSYAFRFELPHPAGLKTFK